MGSERERKARLSAARKNGQKNNADVLREKRSGKHRGWPRPPHYHGALDILEDIVGVERVRGCVISQRECKAIADDRERFCHIRKQVKKNES